MKNLMQAVLAAALIAGIPVYAQKDAPEIKFDSVPNALQLPAGMYLGEVAGVATNSRGNIFARPAVSGSHLPRPISRWHTRGSARWERRSTASLRSVATSRTPRASAPPW